MCQNPTNSFNLAKSVKWDEISLGKSVHFVRFSHLRISLNIFIAGKSGYILYSTGVHNSIMQQCRSSGSAEGAKHFRGSLPACQVMFWNLRCTLIVMVRNIEYCSR